jgi:hypothetical protein
MSMRRADLFPVAAVFSTATALAMSAPAGGASAKPCGVISGPATRVSGTSFNHYSVMVINTDCAAARSTVGAILSRRWRNSRTPIRVNAPAGWVCVAQEVTDHVAVYGHCQVGRKKAIAWVGAGVHP